LIASLKCCLMIHANIIHAFLFRQSRKKRVLFDQCFQKVV
jgi:hypothetical protein